jgi:hypothetical protein
METEMKVMSMFRNRMASFHKEEKGMETLQVVLIIAVAAVILAIFVRLWPEIRDWAEQVIEDITSFEEEG